MRQRLRQNVSLASIAAVLTIAAAAANADSITASLYSPQAPNDGTPIAINLSAITPPSQATIVGSGYTITFSVATGQGVVQNTVSNLHATPVAGVTGADTAEYLAGFTSNVADSGNYLSTGTGTITITFSTPQDSLALLWGSIDTGNSLMLNDASNYQVTGADVQAAAAGFVSNGFQGPGGSAWVVIDTSTTFTSVTMNSTNVSFESSAIEAADAPFATTPEPQSWLLIAAGLGTVLVARRHATLHRRERMGDQAAV